MRELSTYALSNSQEDGFFWFRVWGGVRACGLGLGVSGLGGLGSGLREPLISSGF